jgi:hypothetical protein
LSILGLLCALLVHFVELVDVVGKVKLMVGYTCRTRVRICKNFDFGLSEGLPWEGLRWFEYAPGVGVSTMGVLRRLQRHRGQNRLAP